VLWILLDIALGVLSITVLGLVGFSLYRHIRTLLRALGASASTLGEASADLSSAQSKAARQD
jgi:hypothetical protein